MYWTLQSVTFMLAFGILFGLIAMAELKGRYRLHRRLMLPIGVLGTFTGTLVLLSIYPDGDSEVILHIVQLVFSALFLFITITIARFLYPNDIPVLIDRLVLDAEESRLKEPNAPMRKG